MKAILTVMALVVFASGMVLAQQKPPEEKAQQNQTVTLEGCLGGSAGHYTLLTREGQSIQIESNSESKEDLGKLVGHTVSASGVENPGPASTSNTPAESPNGATNTGAEKILSNAQVTDVSSTCNESTTKAKPQ